MNTSNEAGTPRTIDSKGNIIPKPHGLGRWHSPRKYGCTHEGCNNPAQVLAREPKAHNCCGEHPQDYRLSVCQLPTCDATETHGHHDGGWPLLPREAGGTE